MCVCVCEHRHTWRPEKALGLELQEVWAAWRGCGHPNLGPLQEQRALLTAALSLRPLGRIC